MRRWLARRERQGLTLRELSQQTGVPVGTLGCWAWKLRREGERPGPGRPSAAGFVELVSQEAGEPGRVEIVLAGGRRILVAGAVDEERLVCLVRALERC